MKKIFITAIIISSFLTSCDPDPDKGSNANASTSYFPEVGGNYWTYNVKANGTSNRDSLYVLKDTVMNSKTYKKMETNTTPFGFLSTSLNKNEIRKDGNKVLMSGDMGLNFSSALAIDFKLDDFVIFNESAAPNDQLGTTSGTLQKDAQGYPLTIDYILKSVAQTPLASFTSPNNTTYQNVIPVKVILNLKISASMAGLPITVMNTQDVVTSTQYYAKNIGVVYTNTVMHYQLQDFSKFGVTLPIPQSGNETQEEFLDKYKATN